MNELYGSNRTCIVNIRLLAQRQLGLLNGIKGNGAGWSMYSRSFILLVLCRMVKEITAVNLNS